MIFCLVCGLEVEIKGDKKEGTFFYQRVRKDKKKCKVCANPKTNRMKLTAITHPEMFTESLTKKAR